MLLHVSKIFIVNLLNYYYYYYYYYILCYSQNKQRLIPWKLYIFFRTDGGFLCEVEIEFLTTVYTDLLPKE